MREGITFNDVLLVPKKGIVETRQNVDLSTFLLKNRKTGGELKLSLPIIAAPMDTVVSPEVCSVMSAKGGVAVLHRFQTIQQQAEQARKARELGTQLVGAAIGLKQWRDRAIALDEAGVDFFVLDVAHGHHEKVIQAVEDFKAEFDYHIIVGNVATKEATKDLIEAGADAIKVGIGPGAACTTRIVTGCGVPQLTAVMDCHEVAREHDIPIIADGGIRTSGDMVKALAAGADTVMVGSLIAGTDEAPGEVKDGYKEYRGMASHEANHKKFERMNKEEDRYFDQVAAEGVSGKVHYKGGLADLLDTLSAGIRSGISYMGARDITGLKNNADFVKITSAGRSESQPHDIKFQ